MMYPSLGAFVADDRSPAPAEVRDEAVNAFVDTVGVMIQGARQPVGRSLATHARSIGSGGESRLAAGGATDRVGAALANGTAAHAQDFDDATTEILSGHVSAVVVPTVLAVGQAERRSGREVIEAFARGYEVEIALARAVNPVHYEVGHHPTSTLGAIAAAAAAARLLHLDAATTAIALGMASSFSSGIKANFGTMTKPLHCGWAAHAGVTAAQLAALGVTANPSAYEARQGFGPVYGRDTWVQEPNLDVLGDPWTLVDPGITLRKLWPCCGALLTTIEAATALRENFDLDPERIVEIDCGLHVRRLPHTDRPEPMHGDEGRFSVQYVAAAALSGRPMTEADFTDEAINDPQVRALMSRCVARADEVQTARTDAMDGDDFGARVSVTLDDGTTHSMTVDYPRGSSRRPLSADEIDAKFLACTEQALGAAVAHQLLDQLRSLDRLDDVAVLPIGGDVPIPQEDDDDN